MTLNDNPRVTAERRRTLLWARLGRLNEAYRRWTIEHDDAGGPKRMWWTGITNCQMLKADKVRKIIFKEIRATEKFIASFR